MKVGTKLGLGFAAVIAMLIVVAVVGITSMRTIQGELGDIINDKFPKTVWANNMIDGINVIARAMRNSLLETDKEKVAKELDRVVEARKVITDNLEKLQGKIKSEEGKVVLAKVQEARSKYVDAQNAFITLVKEGKQEDAKVYILKDVRPLQTAYIDSISKLIEFQSNLMTKAGESADGQVQSSLTIIIIIALLAIVAGIVVALLIIRGL
ncbi:MAG: MCP four helix bundle domain-containing protein, partial [Gallionella sp.]